jgi:sulfur carrier protein
MRLNVNGEERELACRDLADVWRAEIAAPALASAGAATVPKGFAIALNGAVVRRDAWATTAVRDGDRIEIIRAMQGG